MRQRFILVALVLAPFLVVPVLAQTIDQCNNPYTPVACVYMPMMDQPLPTPTPLPPTATPIPPTPTPAPPPIETLVLQLSDMPRGFVQDSARLVTNEQAAAAADDPKDAAAAFAQQGREIAYQSVFICEECIFSGAAGVSDQAIRYGTVQGALDGQNYLIDRATHDPDAPGYQYVSLPNAGQRMLALRRTFTDSGYDWAQYFVVVQQGRYNALVQAIGLRSVIDASDASFFVQRATAKLPK